MKVSDEMGDGTIHCEGCSSANTHLLETVIVTRSSQDGEVSVTVVDGSGSIEQDSSRFGTGWSARRDSVAIRMGCEQCDAVTLHTFADHKGTAYLETLIEP